MNMREWIEDMKAQPVKKPMPVLSFPGIQFMDGVTVRTLVQDSQLQAACMKEVASRVDASASVSFMDLSVEAEAFGAEIVMFDEDVPAVRGALVSSLEEAEALEVPAVYTGRTGVCIDAIRLAKEQITDRPVFAGVIGPFSLAGRLVDVSEAMVYCYEEPEMLHALLEKCVAFSIAYIREFKKAGANGVVLAEPLSGVISPEHEREFSAPYVRQIVEAVQDDEFLVIYHNCGNYTYLMTDSIAQSGCLAYHFGNSVDMEQMLRQMPRDVLVMGNVDPAGQFRNGTPESMKEAAGKLMEACGGYSNFVPSSGCDIPPVASWDNIHAFFDSVNAYYHK